MRRREGEASDVNVTVAAIRSSYTRIRVSGTARFSMNVNVDVEIDFADTALRRATRAAFTPAAGAQSRLADVSLLLALDCRMFLFRSRDRARE